METEVWFNTIHACRTRNIPVYLANARLSDKSYRGYLRVHELARAALNELAGIGAQSEADSKRFQALGADNVTVVGNIKFDIEPDAGLIARSKVGRAVTCRLTAGPMEDAMQWLNRYQRFWTEQLDRLAAFVEDDACSPNPASPSTAGSMRRPKKSSRRGSIPKK